MERVEKVLQMGESQFKRIIGTTNTKKEPRRAIQFPSNCFYFQWLFALASYFEVVAPKFALLILLYVFLW